MTERTGRHGRREAAAFAGLTATLLAVSACAAPPPPDSNGGFAIESFFDGSSASKGEIDTFYFWTEDFTADFKGRTDNRRLALDETFHFEKGDRLQRWSLTALPDGRYAGTVETTSKEGALSPAVEVSGYKTANGAVLSYDGYAPGGGDLLLHFRHWMEAQGDGTVLNQVRISKFGIPIAGARVVFSRVPPPAEARPGS